LVLTAKEAELTLLQTSINERLTSLTSTQHELDNDRNTKDALFDEINALQQSLNDKQAAFDDQKKHFEASIMVCMVLCLLLLWVVVCISLMLDGQCNDIGGGGGSSVT
jgi:hypothetical protein